MKLNNDNQIFSIIYLSRTHIHTFTYPKQKSPRLTVSFPRSTFSWFIRYRNYEEISSTDIVHILVHNTSTAASASSLNSSSSVMIFSPAYIIHQPHRLSMKNVFLKVKIVLIRSAPRISRYASYVFRFAGGQRARSLSCRLFPIQVWIIDREHKTFIWLCGVCSICIRLAIIVELMTIFLIFCFKND